MFANNLGFFKKPKIQTPKDKVFFSFLKDSLQISPKNLELFELAFLHRSASVVLSDGATVNNERLEYLGDAIIDAIIADYLFRKFPKEKEGFLTKLRSKIVNREHLNELAVAMGLEQAIVTAQSTQKQNICGNVLEAMVGALYLDVGYDFAKDYMIEQVLNQYIDIAALSHIETDFKSRFLEWGQKYRLQISFKMIVNKRNVPEFVAQAFVNHIPMSHGKGRTKKSAEQEASQNALAHIHSPEFSIKDFLNFLSHKQTKAE
ncbi:ribonuclease 3 [Bacteroidia bacterium]|nr:ribonuclease 3 [Bacteroidia bacterium]